ncbi:hypothetical protein SDC9_170289 [bioreactor metagenome]|uniref:Uncharacterized protein n=1 Tax=bioreactor metagenome TaxID=1076179 RepID=A0A645GG98_9ZZZZ
MADPADAIMKPNLDPHAPLELFSILHLTFENNSVGYIHYIHTDSCFNIFRVNANGN